MKKPRVTDFDPNAKLPELSSPLDDMPIIQKPLKNNLSEPADPSKKGKEQLKDQSQLSEETTQKKALIEQKNEVTNERFIERSKIRHTFDIFSDQLLSLRELALNREKVFGKRVLLGDLVQEALDMFITKERNKD